MYLIIHRGAKEIGGSCVEVFTDKTRIVIDLGLPLVNKDKTKFDQSSIKGKSPAELRETGVLPAVDGLYCDQPKKIDALLLSHSHMDHYGFLQYINPDIPVYMSYGVKKILEASELFLMVKIGKPKIKLLSIDKIGDISVRDYLVDHSGFDARAFLLESGVKRLFYSGDFRGHGRKKVVFDRLLKNPPRNIDCLLMEGSTLGRYDYPFKSEEDVEAGIAKVLAKHKNIVFLATSAQNIDRLVSAHQACLNTGSQFVIDYYTAFVLDKVKKVSKLLPTYDAEGIRTYYIGRMGDVFYKSTYRPLLKKYGKTRITSDEIKEKRQNILMIIRNKTDLAYIADKIGGIEGTTLIYSMWEDYLKDDLKSYCAKNKINIEYIHVSGHAIQEDLKKFVAALKPKKLIPIHTFYPQDYKKLFGDMVCQVKDGKLAEV